MKIDPLVLLIAANVVVQPGAVSLGGATNSVDVRSLPVVPDWVFLPEEQWPVGGQLESDNKLSESASATCNSLISFATTSHAVATRFDSSRGVTEIYIGDFFGNRIIRHDLTASLVRTAVPLPLPYGVVFLAMDLDNDGHIELVTQGGDEGLGGNGWLDIRSAPDWTPRAHFVFPGMKVYMRPTPAEIDGDSIQELFATPQTLGGFGYAIVIDYDVALDSFYIRSQINAPSSVGGTNAIADFDSDGRLEVLKGSTYGYVLFEWQDSVLVLADMLCDNCTGNYNGAVACRPRADGRIYALLGNNDGSGDYHYDLITAIGDNQYLTVASFFEPELAWGITPCGATDFDCDGLDELVMLFPPFNKVWQWNEDSCKYVHICSWPINTFGTINYWHTVDLNQNGIPEFGGADDGNFVAFQGPTPLLCDTATSCPFSGICYCPCFGDANCDSVTADVLDVVRMVGVAFRSENEVMDTLCAWPRSDVTCDGTTDVTDVVRVINVAFRSANTLTEFCVPCPSNLQSRSK